jgi:hypothetical protein
MVIDTDKLKISTKSVAAFVFGFAGLMQIPAVGQFVSSVTTRHPGLASLVATLTAVSLLLHDPQVDSALGVDPGVKS